MTKQICRWEAKAEVLSGCIAKVAAVFESFHYWLRLFRDRNRICVDFKRSEQGPQNFHLRIALIVFNISNCPFVGINTICYLGLRELEIKACLLHGGA